ncbi:hypothetical protein [Streptomyces rubellomurinus]|uniref:Uncharacterized protein n=2 Tax=Streptomyces TaxID=1883 RepID=A0A0F2T650_STRR3|nr:hypothetical protein [Streptomyces rubellomurinus]KJS55047.1 hypothetical protein VM98_15315 [Streptomyces rubellomurinus subsp. indigoferus]KJS57815.1 hypothetical protein VM95_37340 [Streptomyces rubellomurinus]
MASQLTGDPRRRRRPPFVQSRSTEQQTRHPAVALAMALPCAVLLVMLFGGWDQMVNQASAVADLIGR